MLIIERLSAMADGEAYLYRHPIFNIIKEIYLFFFLRCCIDDDDAAACFFCCLLCEKRGGLMNNTVVASLVCNKKNINN